MLNRNNLFNIKKGRLPKPDLSNYLIVIQHVFWNDLDYYLMRLLDNAAINEKSSFTPVIPNANEGILYITRLDGITYPYEPWTLANEYPYYIAGLYFALIIENIDKYSEYVSDLKLFIKDLGDNYFKTAYTYYNGDTPLRFTAPKKLWEIFPKFTQFLTYPCSILEERQNIVWDFVQDI